MVGASFGVLVLCSNRDGRKSWVRSGASANVDALVAGFACASGVLPEGDVQTGKLSSGQDGAIAKVEAAFWDGQGDGVSGSRESDESGEVLHFSCRRCVVCWMWVVGSEVACVNELEEVFLRIP